MNSSRPTDRSVKRLAERLLEAARRHPAIAAIAGADPLARRKALWRLARPGAEPGSGPAEGLEREVAPLHDALLVALVRLAPGEAASWIDPEDPEDAPAMAELGGRLLEGAGLAMDPEAGAAWLERSAGHGHAAARLALAERRLDGRGLAADAEAGAASLRALAEAGEARAIVQLANRLIDGRGLAPEPQAGRAWLERAAEAGDGRAALALGQRLIEGLGLPPEPTVGADWVARAAETRFPPAMEAHGARLLALGDPAGKGWLEAAAREGFAPAMTRLALALDDRDRLRRAAGLGHGPALGELGLALWETDPEAGAKHMRAALARGELHYGLVLGVRHYRARDFGRAAEAFLACWRLGAASAAVNIAAMKRRGEWPEGLKAPGAEALLQPLVEAGNPWALVNMAILRAAAGDEATAAGLMARLSPEHVAELRPWWEELAGRGDPEGPRVLDWLEGR